MNNFFQDIVGNLIIFITAWFLFRHTEKRNIFYVRTALCFVIYSSLRYIYFYHLMSLFGNDGRSVANIVGFALLILLSAIGCMVSFRVNFWSALFCGAIGYGVQHITNIAYRLIAKTWMTEVDVVWRYVVFITLAVTCLAMMSLYALRKKIRTIQVDSKYVFVLTLIVFIASIYLDFERNITEQQHKQIMAILFSGIMFLLQMNLLSSKQIENERDLLREFAKEEQEQYLFEKSMIDMVNIKCHDLKHQFAKMEEGAQGEFASQVKPIIDLYDSRFRTENVALDVVLNRKSFTCKEKGIELTCMAHAHVLDQVAETDVYSLFGNILDNAIEASEKLEEKDKRVVSLLVEQKDKFVLIHSENYYAGTLNFFDGLPMTTKGDSVFHGFGMKSIRSIVENYGGSMQIATKGDRFALEIMLPV